MIDAKLKEKLLGIAGIRAEYKRRRNLVKMLDDLERKRDISSRIEDYQ